MRNIFRKALYYNIIGIFVLVGLYLLKYDMNRSHTKDILLIFFLGEASYWLTILFGTFWLSKTRK